MCIMNCSCCRYDAVIDAITDDGLVAVSFEGYGNSDVTKLSLLKERIPGESRGQHKPGVSAELDKNKYEVTLWHITFYDNIKWKAAFTCDL